MRLRVDSMVTLEELKEMRIKPEEGSRFDQLEPMSIPEHEEISITVTVTGAVGDVVYGLLVEVLKVGVLVSQEETTQDAASISRGCIGKGAVRSSGVQKGGTSDASQLLPH